MTNQTPTPEQEPSGKVALAQMAECLSDNPSYAALGPAIRSIAAYVSELEEANASAIREATSLAEFLWKHHYAETAPNWEVLPYAAGAISQIDNMVTGITQALNVEASRADAAEAENARLREALYRLTTEAKLDGMQWRYDMENTPAEGETLQVIYRSEAGNTHHTYSYRQDDGQWRDTPNGMAGNIADMAQMMAVKALLGAKYDRMKDVEIGRALGWRVSHDEWWNWKGKPDDGPPIYDPPGDAWCIRRDARSDLPCNEALPMFTSMDRIDALKTIDRAFATTPLPQGEGE